MLQALHKIWLMSVKKNGFGKPKEGNWNGFPQPSFPVVPQPYSHEADNAYVILGNDALLACEIPSFVSEVVTVEAWVEVSTGEEYRTGDENG